MIQILVRNGFAHYLSCSKVRVYFIVGGVEVPAINNLSESMPRLSYTPTDEDVGKEIRFVIERAKEFGSSLSPSYDMKTNGHPIVGNASVTVNKPDAKGFIRITGQTEKEGLKFTDIYLDDSYLAGIYDTSIDYEFYAKQLDVGVHKLKIKLNDGKEININFPISILEVPKNNVSQVKTYDNFLIYNVNYSVNSQYDGVYVQLKKGNGKWGSYYGPFKSWEKKKIKGLSPNTTYQIRTVFIKGAGTNNQYMGPYSKTITVKTGKKGKPSIKSVKISNVKQTKKYQPSKLWWDAGGVKHYVKGHYTYTTTYKITVKLKKKPGTKGICIGNHKLKGNKKTYTLKVKSSGKLKGKKVKVSVMSYNNNSYGAYSGIYTKKLKIK